MTRDYCMQASVEFTLGNSAYGYEGGRQEIELVAFKDFRPREILAGAPKDAGAFILYRKEFPTMVYDLSVAATHKQPIGWGVIERNQKLTLVIENRGFVPRGYICGANILIPITIVGEEL